MIIQNKTVDPHNIICVDITEKDREDIKKMVKSKKKVTGIYILICDLYHILETVSSIKQLLISLGEDRPHIAVCTCSDGTRVNKIVTMALGELLYDNEDLMMKGKFMYTFNGTKMFYERIAWTLTYTGITYNKKNTRRDIHSMPICYECGFDERNINLDTIYENSILCYATRKKIGEVRTIYDISYKIKDKPELLTSIYDTYMNRLLSSMTALQLQHVEVDDPDKVIIFDRNTGEPIIFCKGEKLWV